MTEPKLSLIMIVRDEEEMLPRCLKSVGDCVDEIVVVDTGSKDRTVEIALEHSARVYHHPWEGDFSKHQNQSADYATGDWLLQMDGDEELADGSGEIIRAAIRNLDADALLVNILSYFNNGASCSRESKIRLFRNRPEIRYENIVHKQLRGYKSPKAIGATIYHYGYDLNPEEQKKKFLRTSSLLKKQIEEEPRNHWHRHNLAVAYASSFMFREAIEEGERAFVMAGEQGLRDSNLAWTCYIVAASYLKLEEPRKAEIWAQKALSQNPRHLDAHFVLVLVYHQGKQWDELEKAGRTFFRIIEQMHENPERFAGSIINTIGEGWRVRLALGDLDLEKNRPQRARETFDKALKETPVRHECLRIIADFYRKRFLWTMAAEFYRSALKEKTDDRESWLGLALVQKRSGDREAAISAYRRVLDIDPDSLEAMVQLGDLYYERGLYAEALGLYEKALSREPGLIRVSLRIADLCVRTGDLETCVAFCGNILEGLGLSHRQTLENLSDLAALFLKISEVFHKTGDTGLYRESLDIARRIDPSVIQKNETEGR